MGAAISGRWDLRDTGTTRDYDTLDYGSRTKTSHSRQLDMLGCQYGCTQWQLSVQIIKGNVSIIISNSTTSIVLILVSGDRWGIDLNSVRLIVFFPDSSFNGGNPDDNVADQGTLLCCGVRGVAADLSVISVPLTFPAFLAAVNNGIVQLSICTTSQTESWSGLTFWSVPLIVGQRQVEKRKMGGEGGWIYETEREAEGGRQRGRGRKGGGEGTEKERVDSRRQLSHRKKYKKIFSVGVWLLYQTASVWCQSIRIDKIIAGIFQANWIS